MNKEDLRLLFEFDRWANDRILRMASELTPEQFTRDLRGSFRSVRDVLLHVVASRWGWLTYWREPSPSDELLNDIFTQSDKLFRSDSFPTFAAMEPKWRETETDLAGFVNGVTDEMLARMLPVGTTSLSLAHLMQHLANHSTYHRGQVAMMLRQLGAKAQATDFAEFLMATADSP